MAAEGLTGLPSPGSVAERPARLRTRRRALAYYAIRRLLFVPVGAAFLVTASFFLINLVPSNPGAQILGNLATPDQVSAINKQLGFDEPVVPRYAHYLGRLFHGDLGTSYFSKTSVWSEITKHLPNTLEIVLPALVIGFLLGTALALVAVRGSRGSRPVANGVITLFQALPEFFLAVVLIYVLFARSQLLPAPIGQTDLAAPTPPRTTGLLLVDAVIHGAWSEVGPLAAHMAMPVLTLALTLMPLFARVARASMLRAWDAPYVEFSRANGLGGGRIFGYVMRDISGGLITYVVTALAALIGGAAIVETIFNWNGLGQWIVGSMAQIDIPAIEGFIVVVTLAALALYVLLDVLVATIDPRIEIGMGGSR